MTSLDAHDENEHRHFHADVGSLVDHVLKGTQGISPADDKAMESTQHPDAFLITCIDSRFQPDKALDYGPGVALEYRPISAVIPPTDEADPALLSRMAFRRLKNVRDIVIIAHSDCGGAQAAINIPEPDLKNGGDLDIVANEVHRTGLDIAKLAPEFLKAANGDVKEAGNMLAKDVVVQSYKNLLGYKGRTGYATIEDEVKAGAARVVVLYYDLDTHNVDKFDPAAKSWSKLTDFVGHSDTPPAALPQNQMPKFRPALPPLHPPEHSYGK